MTTGRSIIRRPKAGASIANSAATRPKGTSASELVRQANKWRDGLNPLRALGIRRVVTLLEAGERGEFADLQWTNRTVEKRFPVLRGLVTRRAAALLKLDWDIRVSSEIPKGMESLAEEQRLALREAYDRVSNMRDAIRALARAEFRGFAHLQKHRDASGAVTELHWLPQWNWVRDGQFGDWAWNPEARSTSFSAFGQDQLIGSEALPRADFVIRECESPIDEIALIAFVNSAMARKDWAAFVEIFGLPGSVVILPPEVPAGREEEYGASATAVAEGASGALPHGSDVKFPASGVRGASPFKEFLEWEEKDVVLAGTGGKLTMLTESGSGTLAGGAHQDTFDDIAAGEADEISECLQTDFDGPILDQAFPGRPRLAYFELAAGTDHDASQVVERVLKLSQAGFQADAEEVSEKTGLKLSSAAPGNLPSGAGDPQGGNNGPSVDQNAPNRNGRRPPQGFAGRLANRETANGLASVGTRQLAAAVAADLAPLLRRIAAIDQISDPEIRKGRLEALLSEVDGLSQDILADPESAGVLARIQGAAVANGLSKEPVANSRVFHRDHIGRFAADGGPLSPADNIERGTNAVAHAVRNQRDVPNAMNVRGLGRVDFIWGTPGEVAADYKGGFGLAHIQAKHGAEAVAKLPETLAKGRVSAVPTDPAKRFVHAAGWRAVVAKERKDSAWAITHYEKEGG